MPTPEPAHQRPAEVTQLRERSATLARQRGARTQVEHLRPAGEVDTLDTQAEVENVESAPDAQPAPGGRPTGEATSPHTAAHAPVPCDEASAAARPAIEVEGRPSNRTSFRALGERERERFMGGLLRVVTAAFVGPDGFIFDRDVVRHPGAVVVVPLEADGRHVICVRQFRAAVGDTILELPAGKLDLQDEPPETCAARELEEEIGFRATTMTELCQFYNSPGFTDERSFCYLAEGLQPTARSAQGVEERHMTIVRVDLDDVERMVAEGELVDAKTIVGLLTVRERLRGR